MIYVVTYRNPDGLPEKDMITRGSACTSSELPKEICTVISSRLRERGLLSPKERAQILDIELYSSREAAQEVMDYHNRSSEYADN